MNKSKKPTTKNQNEKGKSKEPKLHFGGSFDDLIGIVAKSIKSDKKKVKK